MRIGKCECIKEFFDLDCSIRALPLEFGNRVRTTLSKYSWTYFSIPIQGIESDIKLSFKKDGGKAYFSFYFNKEKEYVLPNENKFTGTLDLDDVTSSDELHI